MRGPAHTNQHSTQSQYKKTHTFLKGLMLVEEEKEITIQQKDYGFIPAMWSGMFLIYTKHGEKRLNISKVKQKQTGEYTATTYLRWTEVPQIEFVYSSL